MRCRFLLPVCCVVCLRDASHYLHGCPGQVLGHHGMCVRRKVKLFLKDFHVSLASGMYAWCPSTCMGWTVVDLLPPDRTTRPGYTHLERWHKS